jgi:hypothetical protein
MRIDSASVGDPARFVAFDALVRGLDALPPAPRGAGRLALTVRRGEEGVRETPERIHVTPQEGVPGDAWGRRFLRTLNAQIAVIQADVAALVANGQPIVLTGDNLVVELDLSNDHLAAGARLRIGKATFEVTPKPHNGCKKFEARFGADALRFVQHDERRWRNLRGIYLRVVEAGEIAQGDRIDVIASPSL